MTIIGDVAIPETGVRVINDPDKIINLLCDLPDNEYILQMLDIFKEDGRPGKMFYRHVKEKMYMLLLYKSPKWMEPKEVYNPSGILIFVASSLSSFIKFFHIWFNKEEDSARKNILFDVQDMLYEHLKLEKERPLKPQL